MPVSRADLLAFMRGHLYAVQASVSPDGEPQAAVVGIAVADDFSLVYDTLDTSRKARNMVHDQRVAFVIGGTGNDDEQSVQYEGVAERLLSADMRVVEELYFRKFPGGRDRLSWKGIMHIRVRPRWLRYSDFRANPPVIVELSAAQL